MPFLSPYFSKICEHLQVTCLCFSPPWIWPECNCMSPAYIISIRWQLVGFKQTLFFDPPTTFAFRKVKFISQIWVYFSFSFISRTFYSITSTGIWPALCEWVRPPDYFSRLLIIVNLLLTLQLWIFLDYK